ncbi:hypothetical protein Tco_1417857, partial [Tanacetum coccineum]
GSPKGDTFVVHAGSIAARIRERKCKTRGGSLRPPVKRKLAFGLSTSRTIHAKASAMKDDTPVLSISDDDEGLEDCLKLKDATACHLKISAITLPALKGFLDNHLDVDLLDLHDQKISLLVVDAKLNKANLDKLMLESQKWSGYQEVKHDRREVVSKVVPYAFMELLYSDELGRLVRKLVSSAITFGRCRAYEQVARMKEPFDLSKVKGLNEYVVDASAFVEALLSKKPPTLQKPIPSRTQMPMPSSQLATPSFAPSSKPMSPPADIVKPSPSQNE